MPSYPAIIIRKERERAIANRHPWLFSGAIEKYESEPQEGDIVRILDRAGKLLAYGFHQGSRSIAARLFYFTSQETTIDDAFWVTRFESALAYRKRLGLASASQAGYRLIFSEGDYLPGLVVDIFDDCAIAQITSAGMAALKPLLLEFLKSQLRIRHLFLKIEEDNKEGQWLLGHKTIADFVENDLKLSAQLEQGQKTGYFFDQRDNRKLVSHYAKGRNVVDAFCYSGGFSCNAMAGGATKVTSVDISSSAIESCKHNVQLNFGSDTRHDAVATDCFDFLRQMKAGERDLIVLDPPAFSKSAHTVERASRGYKDINLVAMQKIAPRGLLFTFSCSQHITPDLYRKIIFGAAKDAGRNVRIIHQMTQGADHPVDICHPEGEYLKGLVLWVE